MQKARAWTRTWGWPGAWPGPPRSACASNASAGHLPVASTSSSPPRASCSGTHILCPCCRGRWHIMCHHSWATPLSQMHISAMTVEVSAEPAAAWSIMNRSWHYNTAGLQPPQNQPHLRTCSSTSCYMGLFLSHTHGAWVLCKLIQLGGTTGRMGDCYMQLFLGHPTNSCILGTILVQLLYMAI